MYFTKGQDREYEALMQIVPGFDKSREKEKPKQEKQHNSKGKAKKKVKKKPKAKPQPPPRERNPALEKARDCPHCLYWKGCRIGCIHEICPVFPE